MTKLDQAKRVLREHPCSGSVYKALAREWLRTRVGVWQRVFGRYYTGERFDRVFRDTPDPWSYESDAVSRERRRLLLEILPPRSYARLLEIGCAEGWMTLPLSNRAEELVAADISGVALGRARDRCRSVSNIRFVQLDLVTDPMLRGFDAIVCAGVLVYVPAIAQERVRDSVVASLHPGGDLLLEHTCQAYPGEIAGSEIHALYRRHPELTVTRHEDVENYAITLFRKGVQ
jgi:protein-L-isoaspartate O-methyltransferase